MFFQELLIMVDWKRCRQVLRHSTCAYNVGFLIKGTHTVREKFEFGEHAVTPHASSVHVYWTRRHTHAGLPVVLLTRVKTEDGQV